MIGGLFSGSNIKKQEQKKIAMCGFIWGSDHSTKYSYGNKNNSKFML